MTRTEERLADALGAAARAMRDDTMRPLVVPAGRQRRLAWAAPAASAAGLLLVVGLAVVVAGHLPGSGHINGGPTAPHRYYVEADRNGDLPVVRSTATGAVTATVQVPQLRRPPQPDLVAAAGNGFFFAAVVQATGERIYRFRLTEKGQVSGLKPLPGGNLASSYWDVHAMAASPDGASLAFALTYTGPAGCEPSAVSSVVSSCLTLPSDTLYAPGPSDNVAVVNTATGAKRAWQGAPAQQGTTFSVLSMSWSANSQAVMLLGRQCPVQGRSVAEACTTVATGSNDRTAAVWQLGRTPRAGRLNARTLHHLDATYSYLWAAQISADGSTITAVWPPQIEQPAGSTGDSYLVVQQTSTATNKLLDGLYVRNLGRIPLTINNVPYATLSTDASGQHWLLGVSYCDRGRCSGGLNGWIDHGRLVSLQPGDGTVADEAW